MQKSFRIFKYPFAHSSEHELFPLACMVVLQLLLHVSKDRYPPRFLIRRIERLNPFSVITTKQLRQDFTAFYPRAEYRVENREKKKKEKLKLQKDGISFTKRPTCYNVLLC